MILNHNPGYLSLEFPSFKHQNPIPFPFGHKAFNVSKTNTYLGSIEKTWGGSPNLPYPAVIIKPPSHSRFLLLTITQDVAGPNSKAYSGRTIEEIFSENILNHVKEY